MKTISSANTSRWSFHQLFENMYALRGQGTDFAFAAEYQQIVIDGMIKAITNSPLKVLIRVDNEEQMKIQVLAKKETMQKRIIL